MQRQAKMFHPPNQVTQYNNNVLSMIFCHGNAIGTSSSTAELLHPAEHDFGVYWFVSQT
jgi:hypothetical protein